MMYMDLGPLLLTWIKFYLSMDNKNTSVIMCGGEITYPFPNVNDVTVEIWDWINNFISICGACNYLTMLELKLIHVSKLRPGSLLFITCFKGQVGTTYCARSNIWPHMTRSRQRRSAVACYCNVWPGFSKGGSWSSNLREQITFDEPQNGNMDEKKQYYMNAAVLTLWRQMNILTHLSYILTLLIQLNFLTLKTL